MSMVACLAWSIEVYWDAFRLSWDDEERSSSVGGVIAFCADFWWTFALMSAIFVGWLLFFNPKPSVFIVFLPYFIHTL